jgi:hypothetical protein
VTGFRGQADGGAFNTDAVFDILRSCAAADGWWEQAFRWEPTRG